MLEQFREFASKNGLEFSYKIDGIYDAHRFIFTNPRNGERFSFMIHSPELKARKQNNLQGFIEFVLDGARKTL